VLPIIHISAGSGNFHSASPTVFNSKSR